MRPLILPILSMAVVLGLSNYAVQFPVAHPWTETFLTWGAFTYPLSFLVTDLTNRLHGPLLARKLIYAAFPIGLFLSLLFGAPARIVFASLTAFLTAQLLDIAIFNRWRQASWWRAPLFSSAAGSATDTALFFSLAFWGATGWASYGAIAAPLWVGWAAGDLLFKALFACAMLLPYRLAMRLAGRGDSETNPPSRQSSRLRAARRPRSSRRGDNSA